MKSFLVLTFLLKKGSLSSRSAGESVIRLLEDRAPRLLPEKYGSQEPLRLRCDREAFLTSWRNPVLWKRSKPSVDCSVWMNEPRLHDRFYLTITATARELETIGGMSSEDLMRLTSGFVESNPVEFAYGEAFTEDTFREDRTKYYAECLMPFSMGLATRQLERGLPELPWLTFFGAPYVTLLGHDRLVATPAYRAVAMNGGVYMQLTRSVFGTKGSFDEVAKARALAKEHLGCELFRGGHPPLVPAFDLT